MFFLVSCCLIAPQSFAYWIIFEESQIHTAKPVCNDHLYNKINYLWFITECVLMMTECTNLLFLTISALGHLDELQKAEKYPIRWSL